MTKYLLPEGFKDEVSDKVFVEHQYKNTIINLFQSYGYELVKPPLIEFQNNITDTNNFNIIVKKNEKKLILRDDITMQISRLSLSRLFEKNRPLKLCYYGEVVRKKGSMLRPERQFLQIGAECIGEKNILADVEMMELAFSSLSLVGIKNISIEISSRIFLDKFYFSIRNSKNIDEIRRLIKLKDLKAALNLLNTKNRNHLKNIFSCTGNYFEKEKKLDKLKIGKISINEIKNIKNIIKIFYKNNKKVKIFLDLCEIDDKNYHKGIRFTFFADNVRGEIAKGGRYLSKNTDKEDDSTGFTCYMDTILRASSTKHVTKKIMIPFIINKNKKKQLISKGYTVITHFDDIKKTYNRAKEQNCQFYLIGNIIKKI